MASEFDEIGITYADLLSIQRALTNGHGFVEAHDIAISYQSVAAATRRSALNRQLDDAVRRVNGYIAEFRAAEEDEEYRDEDAETEDTPDEVEFNYDG